MNSTAHFVWRWSVVLWICLSLVRTATGVSGSRPCPQGQYRDWKSVNCLDCSACKINHIVRRPCTAYRDTECGPFYEFDFFNLDTDGQDSEGSERSENGVDPRAPDDPDHGGHKVSSGDAAHRHGTPTKGPALDSASDKWRELCFGLIGALAAVSLFAFLYVIITQIRARRASSCKAVTITDPENPVVYYHTRVLPGDERHVMLVDRDVVHLETQLHKNEQRTRSLRRLFNPRTLFSGNDYVEDIYAMKGTTCRTPMLLRAIPEAGEQPEAGTPPASLLPASVHAPSRTMSSNNSSGAHVQNALDSSFSSLSTLDSS